MAATNITTHNSRNLLNATLLRRRDTRFKRHATCRALSARERVQRSWRASWSVSHCTGRESGSALAVQIQRELHAVNIAYRAYWPREERALARVVQHAGTRYLGLQQLGYAQLAPVVGDIVELSS
jgi:hypothetical protein